MINIKSIKNKIDQETYEILLKIENEQFEEEREKFLKFIKRRLKIKKT